MFCAFLGGMSFVWCRAVRIVSVAGCEGKYEQFGAGERFLRCRCTFFLKRQHEHQNRTNKCIAAAAVAAAVRLVSEVRQQSKHLDVIVCGAASFSSNKTQYFVRGGALSIWWRRRGI